MKTLINAMAAVAPLNVEQRRYERHNLCFKVQFSVLTQASAEAGALNEAEGAALYTKSVSGGGLGLQGEHAADGAERFKVGDCLLVRIDVPRSRRTLRCLGRVTWKEVDPDARTFHAGVEFLAVNQRDLDRVIESGEA